MKILKLTLDTSNKVFFYEPEFYVLSNFSAFRLHWQEKDFDTSEHAYQWTKFADIAPHIADRIRAARSAHEAFKIAEQSKGILDKRWDKIKVGIMRLILTAKVQQHEYVRRKLLETGDRELVENSWRDDFWGWGPRWDGRNELGKLWMLIREELYRAAVTDD